MSELPDTMSRCRIQSARKQPGDRLDRRPHYLLDRRRQVAPEWLDRVRAAAQWTLESAAADSAAAVEYCRAEVAIAVDATAIEPVTVESPCGHNSRGGPSFTTHADTEYRTIFSQIMLRSRYFHRSGNCDPTQLPTRGIARWKSCMPQHK
ncbi:hypothetical protein F3087_20135 [Nocardia colli]|uniref:Uncharacterized protein n=1 Tax=Nocardia colli TaxID=2545717 RepID=A0A5N0EIK8_9NOCA|nr:hypothetical protein [Nocardia colli]KAA8887211.1 hypothetical protein F3087_20135 [Nocardia colli]